MDTSRLGQEPSQDTSVTQHEDGTVSDNAVSDQIKNEAPEKEVTEPEVPSYVPNVKFKVQDQEKEFDDWARPFVNKDNESKFRELYEKAHGLDVVKPKLQETRQKVSQLEGYISQREGAINEILSFKKNGDLDRFFESVDLPPQQVAQWLLKKLEIQNLPPEQQAVYNEAERLRREKYDMEKQLQGASTRYVDTAVQARTQELGQYLSQPQVAPLVEQYNSRMGNPSAFTQLVARHGNAVWHSSGGKTDLSVEQAVGECLQMLGLNSQAASPAAQPSGAAQPVVPQPKVIAPSKPTVLPNVGNPASSPISSKPKNLADLRRMAKAASAD